MHLIKVILIGILGAIGNSIAVHFWSQWKHLKWFLLAWGLLVLTVLILIIYSNIK